MITKEKATALLMFCHSRINQKCLDVTVSDNRDIRRTMTDSKAENLENELHNYMKKLEDKNITIDFLNTLPDGLISRQLIHYYETSLKTMNKHLKKGDEVIEPLIALSILSYIEVDKNIVDTEIDLMKLISDFEEISGVDRSLVTKMMKVGTDIVEAVDKSNYLKHAKMLRKRKK